MYKSVLHLREKTEQMVKDIEAIDFEQLVELVDERDAVLERLQHHWRDDLPDADKIKNEIKLLTSYDHIITDKMNMLLQDADSQLGQLNKIKMQKHAYEESYQAQSLFLDEKK